MIVHLFVKHSKGQDTIVVGAKNCTEQQILSEIMAQMLETHSGFKVRRKFNFDNTFICFHALLSGDIDLYSEYTGTALVGILKKDPQISNVFEVVKEEFETRYNLVWLSPFGFNNTYALVMNRARAEALGITKISDLEGNSCKIAFDPEFSARTEC